MSFTVVICDAERPSPQRFKKLGRSLLTWVYTCNTATPSLGQLRVLFLIVLITSVCWCVGARMRTRSHATALLWRREDSSGEPVLSCLYVGSGD